MGAIFSCWRLKQGESKTEKNRYSSNVPSKNITKKSLADIGLPGPEGRKLAAAAQQRRLLWCGVSGGNGVFFCLVMPYLPLGAVSAYIE